MASRKFGRWPERPYDVRSLSDERMSFLGQNPSSLMTYDRPTDRYVIQPNFEPKALLLSVRMPAERKRRSFHASCSWMMPPSVLLSVFVSPTENRADVPCSDPVPASSFAPNARSPFT